MRLSRRERVGHWTILRAVATPGPVPDSKSNPPTTAGNGEESILSDLSQDCRFPVFGNVFQLGCITQGPAQGAGQEVHPCMYVGKILNRSFDEVETMSSVLVSSKPDSGCERTRKQGAAGGKRCLQAAAVRWHWRRWMAERQVRHKELGFSWR